MAVKGGGRAASVGTKPLIKVEGLEKRFPVASHWFRRSHSYVHAVDGISFDLARGESFRAGRASRAAGRRRPGDCWCV